VHHPANAQSGGQVAECGHGPPDVAHQRGRLTPGATSGNLKAAAVNGRFEQRVDSFLDWQSSREARS
jgi:hypothetical protein